MVEYRYAMVLDGGRLGGVNHPSPASRERCMDLVRTRTRQDDRQRLHADYGVWLPLALVPLQMVYGTPQDFEFCPVWLDGRIAAVLLRREIGAGA